MKPISTKQFIEKARIIHNDKYDYSLVKYTNNNTPVDITCNIHGIFKQKPIYHVQRRSGCPTCYRQSQKYSDDVFFEKAYGRFGDTFEYGEYGGFNAPVKIRCKKHGWFNTTPSNHLIGKGGCLRCRSEQLSVPLTDWIERFENQHHGKYDYSNIGDIRSNKPITVICPEHGPFYPIPNNHIKGHGCPVCACKNYVGGYSEDFFNKNPQKKDEMGVLYIIRVWDDTESFMKVGITNRSVQLRFKSNLPYEYDIIKETPMTLYEAHIQEVQILTKHERYEPIKRFSGWTECFTIMEEI